MKKTLQNLLIEIQKQNKEGKVYLETIDSCEGMNTVSVFAVSRKQDRKFLFSITVNDRLYEKYLR